MIVTKELKTPSLLNRNMTDRLPGDTGEMQADFRWFMQKISNARRGCVGRFDFAEQLQIRCLAHV